MDFKLIFILWFYPISCFGTNDSLSLVIKYDSASLLLRNNIEESSALFQELVIEFKDEKNWNYYISTINSLSYIYYIQGNYSKYEESVKLAFVEASKFLPVNNKFRNNAQWALAMFLDISGDLTQALKLNEEILYLNSGVNSDTTIRLLAIQSIAEIHIEKGEYPEAISNFEEILKLINLNKNFIELIPTMYSKIGFVYLKKDEISSSLFYLNMAEKCYKNYIKDQTKINELLENLYYDKAKCFQIKLNFKKSEEYVKRVFALDDFGNKSIRRRGFEILGENKFKLGRYEKALYYYKKALSLNKLLYSNIPKNRNSARYHNYISQSHLQLGNLDSSKYYSNKALKIITIKKFKSYVSQIRALEFLKTKMKIIDYEYFETENIDVLLRGIDASEEALDIMNQLHNSYLTHESKLFLQENSVSIIEGVIEVCHELYNRTGEEQYLEQAFAYAENLKAKTLLGEMRENDALKLTGLPDTLREQERDLRIEIAFYERQINEEKQKKESEEAKIKMWESELFQLNNDYNDLITGIEDDFPKFKMMRNYQNELNIADIRNQLLDEETLILEYFVGEKQAYVFALGKNELQLIPLDSSTFISNEGEALLHYINAPPISGSNVSSTLQKQSDFSNAIFHKAMDQLKHDYKKIIVIPDNVLSYLPFEVLLDKEVDLAAPMLPKEAYVLDDYQFSYNYSVVLLLNKLEQEATAKEAFVGYSPSFSDKMTEATRSCTTDELYSLRCSEKEITSISEILGGTTYKGNLAGKEAFKTQAANYKIIHLATHACIDEENPRFNKIYLADDYLSNGDIQNMDFSADLAVLSACNTGTGKLAKGEGVLSLSRDFIYAGCASILTSLWSVDDCSTSDIMVNYYQNLADGLPKDASLQKAKIDFIDNNDKLKSHPYYWAPFVQIGNTEPLDLGKGIALYWWLLGGAGALAALGLYRKLNS